MRKSKDRLLKDQNTILSDSFLEVCRDGKTNTLVRRRKMPIEDLVYSMINRKGLTLKLELRNYMKITHPEVVISKPGYLKQRMKLNPEAFKVLYSNFAHKFYLCTLKIQYLAAIQLSMFSQLCRLQFRF